MQSSPPLEGLGCACLHAQGVVNQVKYSGIRFSKNMHHQSPLHQEGLTSATLPLGGAAELGAQSATGDARGGTKVFVHWSGSGYRKQYCL